MAQEKFKKVLINKFKSGEDLGECFIVLFVNPSANQFSSVIVDFF